MNVVCLICLSVFEMSGSVCMEYPMTNVLSVEDVFVRNHLWNTKTSYMRCIYASRDPIHENSKIHY